jgi:hypothetical protein
MNRLSNVDPGSNEGAIRTGTLDRPHIRVAKTIHVVSVGSMDCGSTVHDALLGRTSFRLSIATDYRKLWELPAQESVHVAVLHNTLSSFELEAACRLIRQRWSSAKILLVSRKESSLDDGLYDDRAPAADSDVLLTTIERLTGGWHDWPRVKFLVPAGTRRREDSSVPSGGGLRRVRRRFYANWHGRRGGRPPRSHPESPAGPVSGTVEHHET